MTPHDPSSDPQSKEEDIPRRDAVSAVMATAFAGAAGLVPVAVGATSALDPIFRGGATTGESEVGKSIRVGTLDSIPADGTPVQVPVVSELVNAWSCEPDQPIGAVYLLRNGSNVTCFNAICPHAGCFVGYSTERKVFQCPCHTSSFQLDGSRIGQSPSPRDMDPLEVDTQKLASGEVWVRFVNYYPGKEEREAK